MTRMRSESERISSSSSETSRIARALVALLHEPAVHELDRADVEPARRLRGDQHARVAVDLAREHDLLLVAAREAARPRVRPAAADVVGLDQPSPRARSGGRGTASRTSSRARCGSRAGRCSRRSRTRARARAAAGPPGYGRARPRSGRRRRRCVTSSPPTVTVPRGSCAVPSWRRSARSARCRRCRRYRRSRRPGRRTRGRAPSRSPGRRRRAGPRPGAGCRAGCDGALLDAEQHVAPHHQPREALLGRARRRQRLDLLAAAQHGDPVGDSVTSFSLWLMKMIDLP